MVGEKERKYERLIRRSKELLEKGRELYLKGEDTLEYDMELDCIDHFFGAGGLKIYEKIASFCKENNIRRVIDIGCAYGHQSECFLHENINYMGVDEYMRGRFWNNDKFPYIIAHYPAKLPVRKDDLGVSVLCLTWNVYLYEGEKTLREQCEALQRDFSHCLLYIPEGVKDLLLNYFANVKKVDNKLYYFSN